MHVARTNSPQGVGVVVVAFHPLAACEAWRPGAFTRNKPRLELNVCCTAHRGDRCVIQQMQGCMRAQLDKEEKLRGCKVAMHRTRAETQRPTKED